MIRLACSTLTWGGPPPDPGINRIRKGCHHAPLAETWNGRERDQGRRDAGARDGRTHPGASGGTQGRRHPRIVGEVRQMVAGRFQAVAGRYRQGHRAGRKARLGGHQVCAGAGSQFCAEAEGDHAAAGGGDAARRRPRPSPHPGQCDRLLRTGRSLSDGRLGAHVDRHRQGRRGETHHRLRAALQGRAAPGHRRRPAFRRSRRHLCARRRAGDRRHGAGHRVRSNRST